MTDNENENDGVSEVDTNPTTSEETELILNSDNELDIKPLEFKEYKHNRWVDGFAAGGQFFKWVERLGYLLLCLIGVISIMSFWVVFAVVDERFIGLSILMLRITQLGFGMLILALLLKWICSMISEYLYNKELMEIKKEGMQKYVN